MPGESREKNFCTPEVPPNLHLFLGLVGEEGPWISLSEDFPFYFMLFLSFFYSYLWMRI